MATIGGGAVIQRFGRSGAIALLAGLAVLAAAPAIAGDRMPAPPPIDVRTAPPQKPVFCTNAEKDAQIAALETELRDLERALQENRAYIKALQDWSRPHRSDASAKALNNGMLQFLQLVDRKRDVLYQLNRARSAKIADCRTGANIMPKPPELYPPTWAPMSAFCDPNEKQKHLKELEEAMAKLRAMDRETDAYDDELAQLVRLSAQRASPLAAFHGRYVEARAAFRAAQRAILEDTHALDVEIKRETAIAPKDCDEHRAAPAPHLDRYSPEYMRSAPTRPHSAKYKPAPPAPRKATPPHFVRYQPKPPQRPTLAPPPVVGGH